MGSHLKLPAPKLAVTEWELSEDEHMSDEKPMGDHNLQDRSSIDVFKDCDVDIANASVDVFVEADFTGKESAAVTIVTALCAADGVADMELHADHVHAAAETMELHGNVLPETMEYISLLMR